MAEIQELKNLIQSLTIVVTKQGEIQQQMLTSGQTQGHTRSISGISFDKFDDDLEDFDTYTDRLSAYFEVQNVPDDRKVQCFVSLMGPKLFTLLKNLLYPDSYTSKTYENLKLLLKTHLNPAPLVIPARHAFINRKQREGESISKYISELRRMVAPCKYNETMLSVMLRDVFVSGLNSKTILDRIFEEDNITLDKTVELALAIEKATIGAHEILQPDRQVSINKVGSNKSSNYNYKSYSNKTKLKKEYNYNNSDHNKKCLRCAKTNHTADKCYAKNLFCKYCKKNNHVMEVCLKQKKSLLLNQSKKPEKIKVCTIEEETTSLPIYNIGHSKSIPPVAINISINGQVTPMELDTGSGATVIYEKRIRSPAKSMPAIGETSLEWHREWSKHELNLLRDNIVSQCRQAQQHRTLRDMVVEDQVPDIGTLGLTFMRWLQPKRPLRPTRKERKKVPVKSLVGQDVEIIVNIVRAFEVPVRVDVDPINEAGFSLVPVRPFVEVSFQGQRCRTTTAEGANPTWNQDLHIPLHSFKDSISSGEIHNIQDKLYCHLYDEVVVDLLEDDRQRETNIHQRLQRHWLGSLAIPFSSLCYNPRIEGTFQLYSPLVVLGYERESQHRQYGGVLSDNSHLRDTTFLSLFITVHPPLHPPEPFKDKLPCSEESYLEQYLESWKIQMSAQVPHRPVKTLVVNTTGQSVCITRFFRPLDPPVIEQGVDTTAEMAARFVSRIPMVSGSMLFPGLFDIWLTADQVLRLLSGDSEDHAILLCCYLLQLGYKAWLLLGSGVPHGATAYVLTKSNSGDYTLWDPPTGDKYSTQDSFCPLQQVYCLVNQDNIWMNVQREEMVSRTKFDVTRRSDWWPAFGRSVSAPLNSVQPELLEYSVLPVLQTDASLLQDKLEKLLRDHITRWRPTSRTIWNRYITVMLRKLLPSLERATWANNTSGIKIEHLNQLTHSLGSHKMCGFPLNFVYTSVQDIVEAVKATGIHSNENTDVEFALAVYVHTFPCNVISIWVYVASLTVRR